MSQLVDYFNRITSKDPPEPPEPKQNNPPNSKLADYFDRITSKDPPESTEPKQNNPPNCKLVDYFDRIISKDPPPQNNPPTADDSKPLPQKTNRPVKKKPTWAKYQRRKLSQKKIMKELEVYSKCCAQLCMNFLTWAIVLQCRTQYVALESQQDRRTWLDKQMDEMEIGPSSFSYQLPVWG